MADWHDAIQETPAGDARLLVHVRPGGKRTQFPDGYDAWRGRIGIRVSAPAQGGKANAAVCAAVAACLDVPVAAVSIASGATNAQKTIVVAGRPAAHVRLHLQEMMPT